MNARVIRLIAVAALLAACGQPAEPSLERGPGDGASSATVQPQRVAAADAGTPLLAVGDIASCAVTTDEDVAALVEARTAMTAILGDAVYDDGTLVEYQTCFDPAWRPMWDRLYPAVGNHDYHTPNAAGFFEYFEERTHREGKGWYGFDVGDHWRAIVLNTNCGQVGCTRDSGQGRFLASQLAAAKTANRHVVAIAHHPRYSSGDHGSNPALRPFFRMLYEAEAPLFLSGHDHSYERFAPQNATGDRRSNGVRQFVVGTGGKSHYAFDGAPLQNTQVRDATTFGILKLQLRADGYSWRFIRIEGDGEFTDSGSKTLPLP
jgi:hypothetical protein